jgi:hypothetical protein
MCSCLCAAKLRVQLGLIILDWSLCPRPRINAEANKLKGAATRTLASTTPARTWRQLWSFSTSRTSMLCERVYRRVVHPPHRRRCAPWCTTRSRPARVTRARAAGGLGWYALAAAYPDHDDVDTLYRAGPCCAALLCWALCLRTPPGHLSMGWV